MGFQHSANQRQKFVVPNLETSAELICISMDDIPVALVFPGNKAKLLVIIFSILLLGVKN